MKLTIFHKNQIDALPAGRPTDILVAEYLFGYNVIEPSEGRIFFSVQTGEWKECPGVKIKTNTKWKSLPHYSTNLSAVLKVIEYLKKFGLSIEISNRAIIGFDDKELFALNGGWISRFSMCEPSIADTFSLCVCRSALKSVEEHF